MVNRIGLALYATSQPATTTDDRRQNWVLSLPQLSGGLSDPPHCPRHDQASVLPAVSSGGCGTNEPIHDPTPVLHRGLTPHPIRQGQYACAGVMAREANASSEREITELTTQHRKTTSNACLRMFMARERAPPSMCNNAAPAAAQVRAFQAEQRTVRGTSPVDVFSNGLAHLSFVRGCTAEDCTNVCSSGNSGIAKIRTCRNLPALIFQKHRTGLAGINLIQLFPPISLGLVSRIEEQRRTANEQEQLYLVHPKSDVLK